jgi:hypothetical protein
MACRDALPAIVAMLALSLSAAAAQDGPSLDRILAVELDFDCRRAYLSEVLDELHQRMGLRAAFPAPIDGSFALTIEPARITVRQVLERLASVGGLDLEYDGDEAVFWRKADETTLAAL